MDDAAAFLQRVAAGLRPLGDLLNGPANGDTAGADAHSPTEDERRYLAFYRIDLADHYPGCRQRLGFVESVSEKLAVHVFEHPQPAGLLLLVHGYTDHVGLYGHLVRYGLERGYTVVAFDLPGHGLSTGEPVSIEDFTDYRRAIENVKAACQCLGGDWRVIAQSTGGAALIDYLIAHGDGFEKAVMLAPLVRPRGWFKVLPAHILLHRFRDTVKRTFAENSNDEKFLEWIRSDPLQSRVLSLRWIGALRRWIKTLPPGPITCGVPVLVIQGDADGTVDWRYNIRRVEQLIPGVRIEYLADGRHQLANESQPLRERIYAWIDEFFDA